MQEVEGKGTKAALKTGDVMPLETFGKLKATIMLGTLLSGKLCLRKFIFYQNAVKTV